MPAFKVAVCDDEKLILESISRKIEAQFKQCECEAVIDRYDNPLRLREKIFSGYSYDALFLDIDMPQLSGLQLAKDLRRLDGQAFLLFVSGREEYVFESLQAKPFRFIRKANFDADLSEAVGQLVREMLESREDSHITVQTGTVSLRLDARRIIYVESLDKYLNIVAESKNFSIRYKLSDMEKLLMPYGFLRIHKSYLVNYRCIFSIESRNVVLDSGQKLPLSRYREGEVQQKFRELTE